MTEQSALVFHPALPDLAAAAQGWLRHISAERRMSPLTADAYARDLRQFIAFLAEYHGERPGLAVIDSLAAVDVRAFLARRRQGNVGNRSLLRQLAGIRSFARYCEREGVAKTSALTAIRAPKLARSLPKPLSPALAVGRRRRRRLRRRDPAGLDAGARHRRARPSLRRGAAHLGGGRHP